jgi:hypothetical protein
VAVSGILRGFGKLPVQMRIEGQGLALPVNAIGVAIVGVILTRVVALITDG